MDEQLTSDDPSATNESRRLYGCWLSFALIVFLFVFYFPSVIRFQHQLAPLDRIELAGAKITTEPVGPNWLRSILDKRTMRGFDKVVGVDANGSGFTDESMVDIAGLTDLKVLLLDDTKISDAGLVHLQGLDNLTELSLVRTQISDDGLLHLKGLVNLRELHLEQTQVSGARVIALRTAFPDCEIYWQK